jgi:peptide methionine sulfoxide reductase MsrA
MIEEENNNYENIVVLRNDLLNNISVLFSQPIISYIDILNEFNFSHDNNNNNNNNEIENNLYENIITTLTDDEFKKLEQINYNISNIDKNNCNICLELFNNHEKIIKLKCTHYYHIKCIEKWLKKHNNKCPMCRIEIAKGVPINL